MKKWKIGDRVIIDPAKADRFILPMRKWGKERREGTVINVFWPLGASKFTIIVEFDHAKHAEAANFRSYFYANDLTRP